MVATWRAWREATGLAIRDGYGRVEAGLLCGAFLPLAVRPGSMGKPSPGFDLAVIDEKGHELAPHREELAVQVKPLGLIRLTGVPTVPVLATALINVAMLGLGAYALLYRAFAIGKVARNSPGSPTERRDADWHAHQARAPIALALAQHVGVVRVPLAAAIGVEGTYDQWHRPLSARTIYGEAVLLEGEEVVLIDEACEVNATVRLLRLPPDGRYPEGRRVWLAEPDWDTVRSHRVPFRSILEL